MVLPGEPIRARGETSEGAGLPGRRRHEASGSGGIPGAPGVPATRPGPQLLRRARSAGHSPMTVRADETMTTGSEPALILPHEYLAHRCSPVQPANEAKPFGGLRRTAGRRGRRPPRPPPPRGARCAGARAGPRAAGLRLKCAPLAAAPGLREHPSGVSFVKFCGVFLFVFVF